MNHLENQVTELLGLTGTLNVLDAIEHIKVLNHLLKTTEDQRKEWADLCIKKQLVIDNAIMLTPEIAGQIWEACNQWRNAEAMNHINVFPDKQTFIDSLLNK